jgi:integrase
VATLTKAGRHSDGDGLYLVADAGGAKRWVFLFRWQGRLREMGLGGLSKVSLAAARAKAEEARALLGQGLNPIDARKAAVAIPTFGESADAYVESQSPRWRNAKHRAQWSATLKDHAGPLRNKRVNEVTTEHVVAVLKPIWAKTPETASRLRGRIERVLDAARVKGHRAGENPARWRGHLDHILPARTRLSRGHHAALPYPDLPSFMDDLRGRESVSARALEFVILTAARSGEVLGARWGEIDLKAAVWTVPAERMKAGKEHRVPLTAEALVVLTAVAPLRDGEGPDVLVFPGARRERPLSVMAMSMQLRRMGRSTITVHGFRSTFRDWAGECTGFPREVAEAALAHTVGDMTERAYRRGDALEKRRKLMEAWARYCAGAPSAGAKVVTLR